MENNWISKAINQWTSEQIKLNSATSAETYTEAEDYFGFKFPEKFKEMYLIVNGFVDFEWRENMFSLWSIERMIKEYDGNKDKNFIGFCDYLIASHHIGFVKDKSGIFKDYNQSEPITLLFEEVIDFINTDSELIY